MSKNKGTEFNLHIWAKPQDETMVSLFTVSISKRAVCIDMPIDKALESIREEMELAAEQ